MADATFDRLIIGNRDGQHMRLSPNEIALRDAHGIDRIRLFLTRSGTPAFELYDGNGTGRLTAGIADCGSPHLTLRDGNFTGRLELELDEDEGDPSLTLSDRNDKRIFVLGPDYTGSVELRRPDENGNMVPWVPTLGDKKVA